MKEAGLETNSELTKPRSCTPITVQIAQLLACGRRIGPCLRFRPTSIPIPLISDAKELL